MHYGIITNKKLYFEGEGLTKVNMFHWFLATLVSPFFTPVTRSVTHSLASFFDYSDEDIDDLLTMAVTTMLINRDQIDPANIWLGEWGWSYFLLLLSFVFWHAKVLSMKLSIPNMQTQMSTECLIRSCRRKYSRINV